MLWQGGTVGGSCGIGVGAVWGTGWGGAEGSYVYKCHCLFVLLIYIQQCSVIRTVCFDGLFVF